MPLEESAVSRQTHYLPGALDWLIKRHFFTSLQADWHASLSQTHQAPSCHRACQDIVLRWECSLSISLRLIPPQPSLPIVTVVSLREASPWDPEFSWDLQVAVLMASYPFPVRHSPRFIILHLCECVFHSIVHNSVPMFNTVPGKWRSIDTWMLNWQVHT